MSQNTSSRFVKLYKTISFKFCSVRFFDRQDFLSYSHYTYSLTRRLVFLVAQPTLKSLGRNQVGSLEPGQ